MQDTRQNKKKQRASEE